MSCLLLVAARTSRVHTSSIDVRRSRRQRQRREGQRHQRAQPVAGSIGLQLATRPRSSLAAARRCSSTTSLLAHSPCNCDCLLPRCCSSHTALLLLPSRLVLLPRARISRPASPRLALLASASTPLSFFTSLTQHVVACQADADTREVAVERGATTPANQLRRCSQSLRLLCSAAAQSYEFYAGMTCDGCKNASEWRGS